MAVDPKGSFEDFTGQKSVEKLTDTLVKGTKAANKEAEILSKHYSKIREDIEAGAKLQANANGKPISTMGNSLGTMPGRSPAATLGMGAMAVGVGAMGIMPNTMSAVAQRMALEGSRQPGQPAL